MKAKNKALFPPLIFNVNKSARITSYDVVRHFKRNLPIGYGKIGHFGTLDPFASGVLMIGIGGAARMNDFIHEYLPKTYLAVGKLGIETPTGDYTSEVSQRDDSLYLTKEIASFSKDFIGEKLQEKFLGRYMQAPHKYSAAKFMGKNLHEWAREGVEIKKEPVERFVHRIEVVKYSFPYLSVRVTVSSGTYVRTLFSDMANFLGTLGSLISLVREEVGPTSFRDGIKKKNWPHDKDPGILEKGIPVQEVLPFGKYTLGEKESKLFTNGVFLREAQMGEFQEGKIQGSFYWVYNEANHLLGLGERTERNEIKIKINFNSGE